MPLWEDRVTLEQLANETIIQKHRRIMQAKCSHSEVYGSTVRGPSGTFTNAYCLDCGKTWRADGELYAHLVGGSNKP